MTDQIDNRFELSPESFEWLLRKLDESEVDPPPELVALFAQEAHSPRREGMSTMKERHDTETVQVFRRQPWKALWRFDDYLHRSDNNGFLHRFVCELVDHRLLVS